VKELRFLSANPHKVREVEELLAPFDVKVVGVARKIEEIQSDDVELLVRDKAVKAFASLGRPVFVEHTGLELVGLNGLPGGLTQVFWDRLEADRFCTLVHGLSSAEVVARTTVGYCDGRQLHFFDGSIEGTVPATPRGSRDFQWDCVFIPTGESRTFAEMGTEKNLVSMRRRAMDALGAHLRSRA
jgi:XTP/dITP diphosphohydrolase